MQSRNNSVKCGSESTAEPSYGEPPPDARQIDPAPVVGNYTDTHVPPLLPVTLSPPLDISAGVLAAVVQHSTEIISINDAHGIVRYVSPSVEQILGYKPEEMLGRESTDYLHPDDLAEVQ
ncbi:MAG: PAS domain S-box protein, partial [Chloroflexaceae bacterium]|nr:PAS domain S-box protein [Chloroflexaceae bacterium]